MNYADFLKQKAIVDVPTGFDPAELNSKLFDFQSDCVRWACRRGRAALFEDCGLGKTPQQLVWAQKVLEKTNKPVLILAPLSVTHQTAREGVKFGIDVKVVAHDSEVGKGINITNYEKLHHFKTKKFSGVVLDESSILKSFDGSTRKLITESFAGTPYKLACSATPAPNDLIELTNHAEFLNVMSGKEIIALFFKQDGNTTHKWRLKHHAEQDFWKWLCSWAVNIRKPSDLGYSDKKFKLPKLNLIEHCVDSNQPMEGYLIPMPASTLSERRDARRGSIKERVEVAVQLAKSNSEQWVFWCNLNDESEAIANAIEGAEEIRGSTSDFHRERIALGFLDGSIRCVVTKPSIWGFGLNLQCCANTAFVGLSDSYEEFYQVVRRFYRFGQAREVNAHIIISTLEGAVISNIKRKESDAKKMADEMVRNMGDICAQEIRGQKRDSIFYAPKQKLKLPEFV